MARNNIVTWVLLIIFINITVVMMQYFQSGGAEAIKTDLGTAAINMLYTTSNTTAGTALGKVDQFNETTKTKSKILWIYETPEVLQLGFDKVANMLLPIRYFFEMIGIAAAGGVVIALKINMMAGMTPIYRVFAMAILLPLSLFGLSLIFRLMFGTIKVD
jgi:hypothetical protein